MQDKNFKHRSVIEMQEHQDISQEPEMQELARLFDDMTGQEQGRTLDYLAREQKGENDADS
jgi:hypothetical protein